MTDKLRKQFEEIFDKEVTDDDKIVYQDLVISSLIQAVDQQKQELREKIEGMKIWDDIHTGTMRVSTTYNQALDDVLKLLS